MIGYQGEFMTDTRGTGIMSRLFHGYAPWKGPIEGRRNGVLISNAAGPAVAYALWNLEERGPMFITPGADVYPGMIIGGHSRGNDLDVNPLKGKQLSNIRTTAKDEAVRLTPPIPVSYTHLDVYKRQRLFHRLQLHVALDAPAALDLDRAIAHGADDAAADEMRLAEFGGHALSRAAGAGAGRIAGLRHEARYDAVELDPVVKAAPGQRLDLRHGLGREVGTQFCLLYTSRCV